MNISEEKKILNSIQGGEMSQLYSKGLEGVIVDETKISNVEGEEGRLTYRGYLIEDLVQKPFAQVAWLVLFGGFPTEKEQVDFESFLAAHSELSSYEISILNAIPRDTHPMVMLQSLVPVLDLKPKMEITVPLSQDEALQGLIIAAKIPTLIASFHQLQLGNKIPQTLGGTPYHSHFFNLFHQKQPTEAQLKILDVAQILQIEHSFNAGTFAGRVTASTLSPVQSVVSASIGTLYGKLHGGADEAALKMAMSIGNPDKAADFVLDSLSKKQKIMGMGHREYKTVDPRARILKPMAEELCVGTEFEDLFFCLKNVEGTFQKEMEKKGKQIWANVEFYKGAVFYALGIPPHFFTAMFAMARTFGYLAHFIESRQDNRLIRPKALYTGNPVTNLA